MQINIGIEEEVFIVDKEKPGVDSLYPLFKLLIKNPSFYYVHSAVNLSRGKDFFEAPVASVEISTGVASSVEEAVSQLSVLRKELSENCPSKIIALGMLPHLSDAKTIVSGLHIHFSGDFDLLAARKKIARFLPALFLITANSPSLTNEYLSNRILLNPFSGVLLKDSYERFQDVIISRRLKTLEVRIFDPVPDLKRIEILLNAIVKLIESDEVSEPDFQEYTRLRELSAKYGAENEEIRKLAEQTAELTGVDLKYFLLPPAKKIKQFLKEMPLEEVFNLLDEEYRSGTEYQGKVLPKALRAAFGIFGYYLPRIPYTTYKFLKEHGYL